MDMVENILLALESLYANKMRAILTMLGIIIGIGSVIAIVTVGNSLTASISSTMMGMGANSILVSVNERGVDPFGDGKVGMDSATTPEDSELISPEQIEAFHARYSNKIETISLSQSAGSAKAQDGRRYANISVNGVNRGYEKANNIKLLQGRFINEKDVNAVRRAAVVSDRLIRNMFTVGQDLIGQEVKVYSSGSIEVYTIVGVYKYENSLFANSSSSEQDLMTNFYIPVSLAKQDAVNKNYQSFTVVAAGGVDTAAFTNEIKSYFSKFYANSTKWEIGVTSMESLISSMTSMLDTVSVAISIIAGISLLVGGIGVMNIMLVSVTERTREIGTRKALGAKSSYIRLQFIVESVIICLIGGLTGIFIGLILGAVGASLLGYPATTSWAAIVLSVSLTMVIGVFFGYYPANKAAKLDPIEALRYE